MLTLSSTSWALRSGVVVNPPSWTSDQLDRILQTLATIRGFEVGMGAQTIIRPCSLLAVDLPPSAIPLLVDGENWWGFGFRVDTNDPPKAEVEALFRREAKAAFGDEWHLSSKKALRGIRKGAKDALAERTSPRLKGTGFAFLCPRTGEVIWSGSNVGRQFAMDVVARFAGPSTPAISVPIADYSEAILDALLRSACAPADEDADGDRDGLAWPTGSATFERDADSGTERLSVSYQDFAAPRPALAAVLDGSDEDWILTSASVMVGSVDVTVDAGLNLTSVHMRSVGVVADIVAPTEARLASWLACRAAVLRLFASQDVEVVSDSRSTTSPVSVFAQPGFVQEVGRLISELKDGLGPGGSMTIEHAGRKVQVFGEKPLATDGDAPQTD